MMTPESIVTSLEWSKRLVDAVWKEETVFEYVVYPDGRYVLKDKLGGFGGTGTEAYYQAPTAEEILRRCGEYWRCCNTAIGEKRCWIEHELGRSGYFDGVTLANAAAAMWIHLKTNNLLPPQA